jgi:hypothetical protein
MHQAIERPVPRELLEEELGSDIFLRNTNKAGNEIYIFSGIEKPNLMKEVGRLRELSFRSAGGGTGKPIDIDSYDISENGYKQLVVWSPLEKAIVGGYRFIFCKDSKDPEGVFHLSSSEILQFSSKLKSEYFPYTIELGRSFVQPDYQVTKENRKGIFSLDNLWDGLGALVVDNPEMKYFFGKITMYSDFPEEARNMILDFMDLYFPDLEKLASPQKPFNRPQMSLEFKNEFEGLSFKEGHSLLSKKIRNMGHNIPPLFNSYMNLSSTMRTFGTSINEHFGNVQETGIMVTIADIYEEKKSRHIDTYVPAHR